MVGCGSASSARCCRRLAELSQQHAELADEHAAALATAREAMSALESAHATNADLVNRELQRMSKSVRLVESCDLGAMSSQVHRMSRHIDETDIVVKHIKDKVRGPRSRTCPCVSPALRRTLLRFGRAL